ncbi:hypothetical protein RTBOTA2_005384 [Rhodotorula toruloides]|nr:hypothetical protein RTBOTA2_005384 [Rhodotorula toruloides]
MEGMCALVQTLESGTQAWQGGDSLRARETGQPNANATQQGVHLDELSSSSSSQKQSSSGDQSSNTNSGTQDS